MLLIAPLPRAKDPLAVAALPYRLRSLSLVQDRFANRLVITPGIDIADYKARAVVDWVKLRVKTARITQFMYIQAKLTPVLGRKPHVEGIKDPGSPLGGINSQDFIVTIQDPTSSRIDGCIAAISDTFGVVGEVGVTAIEVSLDWRPRNREAKAREHMVGVLQRHMLPLSCYTEDANAKFRTAVGKGREHTFLLARHNGSRTRTTPYLDGTLYWGAKGAPVTGRIMNKVSNNRTGETAETLSLSECSARTEITLLRPALEDLKIKTLSELRRYGFEKLRNQYFQFWLATMPMHRREHSAKQRSSQGEYRKQFIRAFLSRGITGIRTMDGAYERQMGGHSKRARTMNGHLVAFSEMNDRTRHALGRLST